MGSLSRAANSFGKGKLGARLVHRVMSILGAQSVAPELQINSGLGLKPARVKHNRSKYSPHQGTSEQERRRAQMAKGMLKVENGKVPITQIFENKVFATVAECADEVQAQFEASR